MTSVFINAVFFNHFKFSNTSWARGNPIPGARLAEQANKNSWQKFTINGYVQRDEQMTYILNCPQKEGHV